MVPDIVQRLNNKCDKDYGFRQLYIDQAARGYSL
jgi:hypothetical protein